MLSMKRCREILGSDCDLGDAELKRVRDDLYRLAETLSDYIDAHVKREGVQARPRKHEEAR